MLCPDRKRIIQQKSFLHGQSGLLFLSILSLYGICGDFIFFFSGGKSLDAAHAIFSSCIFCFFFFEVVHEQLSRPSFLCTARDPTGWIYILSTTSFLLDATLTSRRLYLGIFISDESPSPTLSFFPGRICIALIFFVYGVRILQGILRFTITWPINEAVRELLSSDPNADLARIDEIGEKLAHAHSTLHTKLGLCIISFISIFGALQYSGLEQSSWDMFTLPLDCQCADIPLWQHYDNTFSELHKLCDTRSDPCLVDKSDNPRHWTLRKYSHDSYTAQLDGTKELQRRARFYFGNVLIMMAMLGAITYLVEGYLRTNIRNLLMSESAPVEEEAQIELEAPNNEHGATPTLQRRASGRTQPSQETPTLNTKPNLSLYFERIVHSVSRRNPSTADVLTRRNTDFESPLEKATALLKSILGNAADEEEKRRIRLAYEIMLSDHSLQGKMTHVIAQSSHLTTDARKWLMKTVSSKVNFSSSTRGTPRKSKFRTRINVSDFQKRSGSSSKSRTLYSSRISESFMISPLNVNTDAESVFTYERQDSEAEEDAESQIDIEEEELLDYYQIFTKEADDAKRFETLQLGPEPLEFLNEGVLDLRWDVDSFRLSRVTDGNPLVHASLLLMYRFDLPQKLNLDMPKFYSFLDKIQFSYNDNIYHNRCHATDVTLSGCCLIGSLKPHLLNSITHLQIFSVIFSCIIHDVGHPGNNNLFETKTNSRLALRYSDKSVLEYYHLALAFRLLRDSNNAFNENWDFASKQNFRKQVINMVLATDLSNHFKILDEVKQIQDINKMQEDDELAKVKVTLFKSIIKMGDLSHACKPIDCHLMWTQRINDEFCRQGDKERELGLEISPLCDRQAVDIPNGQLGFFQFIVQPLFKTCHRFFDPDGSFNEALNQIDINYRYWQERVKEQKALKEKEEEMKEAAKERATSTTPAKDADTNGVE